MRLAQSDRPVEMTTCWLYVAMVAFKGCSRSISRSAGIAGVSEQSHEVVGEKFGIVSNGTGARRLDAEVTNVHIWICGLLILVRMDAVHCLDIASSRGNLRIVWGVAMVRCQASNLYVYSHDMAPAKSSNRW
jgi:hypothetical protein